MKIINALRSDGKKWIPVGKFELFFLRLTHIFKRTPK